MPYFVLFFLYNWYNWVYTLHTVFKKRGNRVREMASDFSRALCLLRQERGISQRKAAAELGVSQALLSHYENGIREPGLSFVTKV